MTSLAIGPILPVAGNEVQMTTQGKVQITDSKGKVKTLSQDQFRKQLIKNMDKIANGEEVKFKDNKKGIVATSIAAIAAGAVAGLGLAVHKNVLKPVKINEKDVMLQKAAKKIQNFAYDAGKKISDFAKSTKSKISEFIAEKFPQKAEKTKAPKTKKAQKAPNAKKSTKANKAK